MAEPDYRIWDQFITERDRRLFVSAGFGPGVGWGVRPALVVIDVTYAFTGEGEPVEESIKRYPLSCGTEAWTAIEYNWHVLDTARQARIPVFYTLTDLRPDLAYVGGWSAKNLNVAHRSMLEGHKGARIVDELARPRLNRHLKEEAERVLRHSAAFLPYQPRRRHGDRHRMYDQLMRSCLRARRIFLQLQDHRARGVLLRPRPGLSRG